MCIFVKISNSFCPREILMFVFVVKFKYAVDFDKYSFEDVAISSPQISYRYPVYNPNKLNVYLSVGLAC